MSHTPSSLTNKQGPAPLGLELVDWSHVRFIVLKNLLLGLTVALVCVACAQNGMGPSAGPGSGSVTMYGTIDTGVTVSK